MNKVAVINFSGNVGKSTISAQLLAPRLPGADILSVESINMDASAMEPNTEQVTGRQFKYVQDELMRRESVIVDVGSSNVEEFLELMQKFAGSHEEIDQFIIPVVKERKAQADTINTMRALTQAGVEKSRIKLIFNKVEARDELRDDFASVIGFAETEGFPLNEEAAIQWNEVYELLRSEGKSLGEVNADTFDYRAAVRTATTEKDKERYIRMVGIKRLAVSANKNLDAVFAAVSS